MQTLRFSMKYSRTYLSLTAANDSATVTNDGCLYLQYAMQTENLPLLLELLRNRICKPDVEGYHGVPALCFAAWCNLEKKHEMMDILIEHGADVNIADSEGDTPLSIILLLKDAHAL